ncbi:hypothetical protein BHM03_00008035 [Ensete ventricosum]|nr:hypothetical protein BHM03_00008035 [Ensete ventricosum]
MLEERRAKAHLKKLHYQRAIARLYNRRGKLAPRWEGSYCITQVIRDETYTLSTTEGKTLPQTWHVSNLKKFYVYHSNVDSTFKAIQTKQSVQKETLFDSRKL